MFAKPKFMAGFTLIELLIVIAIVAIIGATTIPIGSAFLVRSYHTNKINELVSALRTAQINSMNGKDDTTWGVQVTSNQIKMYATNGETAFDQTYSIPSSITITQDTVIFDKLTGNPDTTKTFDIDSNAGDSATITVNEVGTVQIN